MSEEREEELKAALDREGIKYDGRWGVEKLEEALRDGTQADGKPETVACEVLRDFWDENGNRVRKGRISEFTVSEALDGVEAGALKRVK